MKALRAKAEEGSGICKVSPLVKGLRRLFLPLPWPRGRQVMEEHGGRRVAMSGGRLKDENDFILFFI